MRGKRLQLISFAISVAVHLLLLILYRPLALISLSPDNVDPPIAAPRPIVLQLIETPDDAIRQRPDEADQFSDKDAVARNEKRPEDIPEGEAYIEGSSGHKVFRGDISPSSPADLRDGPGQPQRADRDEGKEDDDTEMERPTDMVIRVHQDLDEIFRKRSLSSPQKSSGRRSSQGPSFSDDADFDQRKEAAGALGGITMNTYDWNFASYILEMKRKLRSNTHPPGAFSPLGLIEGKTVLTFRVMPDGRVADLNVIEYTGDRTLMETSVDAVEGSSPFRPLPSDFPMDYLELTWTFIFYVYRR
ncbi:MAG: energy transducer TonB [Candidatus Krumholzibacteriota bacterium]|nr:energy transducer TonB [Candidatus Krumholzibacteriota bacterium]